VALAGSGRVEEVPWPEGSWKVETGDFLCDVRRIGETLGWRPAIDLDRGLLQTVEGYRSLLP
jgi:nucleoside-diphosphate-sugar epimerase